MNARERRDYFYYERLIRDLKTYSTKELVAKANKEIKEINAKYNKYINAGD